MPYKEIWQVARLMIAFLLMCPSDGENFSIMGSFAWFLVGILFLVITYQPSNK